MHDNSRFITTNRILNALPPADLQRLDPMLERVDLPRGKVLYNSDEPITHVYFPERAVVSVVAYTPDGQGTEVAVIGDEGATGLAVVLAHASTPYENVIQLSGGGLRMTTKDIRTEFNRAGALHDLLLQFTQKLIVQISQTALCNRIHSVEQRLSKRLLMCADRSQSDPLRFTQESAAIMLGSSRTSITLTSIELQKYGLISYVRGRVKILDRQRLEDFTCACYGVIKTAYYQASK